MFVVGGMKKSPELYLNDFIHKVWNINTGRLRRPLKTYTMNKSTKVTDSTQAVTVGKPIKIKMIVSTSGVLLNNSCIPNAWDNIQRIATGEFDIMLAWDDLCPHIKVVYLGHWNDGFIDNK